MARTADLQIALAKAEARADVLQSTLDRVLAALPQGVPAAAVAPAPAATRDEPTPVTAKVRALCRRYSDNSARQFSINLQKAQDWAAEGMTEAQIIARLHRGEELSA